VNWQSKTDIAVFKHDQFNLLMNQGSGAKMDSRNKFAGNSKYIPIGMLETITKDFQNLE
jgi:hypothetical protein